MLTKKQLHNELYYDRSTGEFFRVKTGGIQFKDSPAGSVGSGGYVKITINRVSYMAHHLVFIYEYGIYTNLIIDHIDGDPSNNKKYNLRSVTHQDNMKNKSLNSRNKSGINGVQLIDGMYNCFIGGVYLGATGKIDEAANIINDAKVKYGYHPNHGKRKPINIKNIKDNFWERCLLCHQGGYENINKLNIVRGIRV